MRLFFKSKNKDILKLIYEKKRVRRYIQFIIGLLLVACAFNLFLVPNNLVVGGVSGLSIILNYLFGVETYIVVLIGAIILLTLSFFLLGPERTKGTILGSLLFPMFIKLTADIGLWINIDTSQLLLSALFCGVMQGTGIGLVLKAGFSSGGTDILEQIMSKYFHMSMGKCIIIVDGLILVSSGIVFGVNIVMYAIITLYLISYMSDKVILGISDNKAFYIITKAEKDIKSYIVDVLGYKVTSFATKGGHSKEEQRVLMCVLPTKDYYKLKNGIKEIDEDVFFVITDSYEVFGGDLDGST